ncbi:LuxR C-terminal-related transcriptional regulator [Bacteroides sp. UBA939]|uniref:LuxR C-terminal-related transcriptional regulator n=1 Tax=Bacteroides sp. UBA939 TaxID=1946092 RepID=UPI0025C6F0F3|nr:LuxR C-terminal-related transcriptional regulator [Bacteroides sp. UBA939]
MNHLLFTEDTKMADLVLSHWRLLYVLPYFDIGMGFGEKTVKQVCAEKNMSAPLLLLVCNLYVSDDYTPHHAELKQIPIEGIVRYLQNSHVDYINLRVPHLIDALRGLALEGGDGMLALFCEKYRKEVMEHFRYEEEIVFPYIRRRLEGETTDYKIGEYRHHHSDIDTVLEDLKNLLVKFLSKNCLLEQYRPVLSELFMFEYDLRKHTQLEDAILIPLVESLDNHVFRNAEGIDLSEREKEVLAALARGLSNKEIADKLYISAHTVISHRKNIIRKTGIKTPQGLTLYALANNLISQDDLR